MTEIDRLWNGEIAPCDGCGTDDEEINRLVILMERHVEELNTRLSGSQLRCFEKYKDCSEEYVNRMTESAFRSGFCLAGNLFSEVFHKAKGAKYL